mmetsp:Transcript_20517/g.41577  ORF Transcript_20517/g.41577 Transcript_20517/m.41577 type:complete len:116 (+) Transcript_20517:303-650(+)
MSDSRFGEFELQFQILCDLFDAGQRVNGLRCHRFIVPLMPFDPEVHLTAVSGVLVFEYNGQVISSWHANPLLSDIQSAFGTRKSQVLVYYFQQVPELCGSLLDSKRLWIGIIALG